MDALQATFRQLAALWEKLSPSQRLTFVAVPLIVVGGLGALVYGTRQPGHDHLLGGKVFAAEELRAAQEALNSAGLTGYTVDGQRVRVPKADVTRYNAALVEGGAMPAEYGDSLVKMYREAGLWATDSDRQKLMEVGKAQELAKILRAIRDIEDARVSWERAKRRPFGGESKVTALVSVKPKSGRELSSSLVQSIRLSVAGAVADLAPEDVVVLNTRTGQAFKSNDRDDPFGSEFVDQVRKFTEMHRSNISEALSFIPGAMVAVNVDLENLKTSFVQEREIGSKPFSARSVEQTDNSRSTEQRASREPGMQANQPRNLQGGGGGGNQSTQTTERSVNTSENIPTTAKISEKTFHGLLPKTVQVTVQIPREHYRQVALKQGETETDKAAFAAKVQAIEQETEKDVGEIVARLIPAGSPPTAVVVTSFTDLQSPQTLSGPGMVEQVTELGVKWGGPIMMAIFAAWALLMLNRSLKKLPQAPAPPPPAPTKGTGGSAAGTDGDDEPEEERPLTKRDQLQGMVRDNPEMAAAVISKWLLQPGK
jgi:flagellar M-ring protein FliF